jgi:hypothetical protein
LLVGPINLVLSSCIPVVFDAPRSSAAS